MAGRSTGPHLSDDLSIHAKDEHLDSYFGPALRTTDRPDYFSIRSKLVPALIAIVMILSLFNNQHVAERCQHRILDRFPPFALCPAPHLYGRCV